MSYTKKDFSSFKKSKIFSENLTEIHIALYEGYVNSANMLIEKMSLTETNEPQWSEMKRRFGWEFDGMRLHELYFENLGNSEMDGNGKLAALIDKNFGNLDKWKSDFLATAKMRGIGWTILYQDGEQLFNFWINEHDGGHPAGCNPLLVVDVFEHAYFPDFGKDRPNYLKSVIENIHWQEVEKRVE
jgi:superoxide dismutase, Fe-Mn family